MTARQRRTSESRPTEPATSPEAEPTTEPTTEAAQPTSEELMAQLEALRAENEALKARPVRAQREVKATPKQIRFMRKLVANPALSVPELCVAAGATETSHGFVFRMLEHGYLTLTVPEATIAAYKLNEEASTEATEDEQPEAEAEAPTA